MRTKNKMRHNKTWQLSIFMYTLNIKTIHIHTPTHTHIYQLYPDTCLYSQLKSLTNTSIVLRLTKPLVSGVSFSNNSLFWWKKRVTSHDLTWNLSRQNFMAFFNFCSKPKLTWSCVVIVLLTNSNWIFFDSFFFDSSSILQNKLLEKNSTNLNTRQTQICPTNVIPNKLFHSFANKFLNFSLYSSIAFEISLFNLFDKIVQKKNKFNPNKNDVTSLHVRLCLTLTDGMSTQKCEHATPYTNTKAMPYVRCLEYEASNKTNQRKIHAMESHKTNVYDSVECGRKIEWHGFTFHLFSSHQCNGSHRYNAKRLLCWFRISLREN